MDRSGSPLNDLFDTLLVPDRRYLELSPIWVFNLNGRVKHLLLGFKAVVLFYSPPIVQLQQPHHLQKRRGIIIISIEVQRCSNVYFGEQWFSCTFASIIPLDLTWNSSSPESHSVLPFKNCSKPLKQNHKYPYKDHNLQRVKDVHVRIDFQSTLTDLGNRSES